MRRRIEPPSGRPTKDEEFAQVRRLVVFIGGSRSSASTFQRTLARSLKQVAGAGVLVPKAGRRANKPTAVSHQRLANPKDSSWQDLRAEVDQSPADTVLVMIPGLLKGDDSHARHEAVVHCMSGVADEIVVASVVTDQLGLINEQYLHLIANWRTSARLENDAWKLATNDTYVHEYMLRPWYRDSAVRYVGVPSTDYTAGNPVQAVLSAAGVETPDLGEAVPPPATLGPRGVEANRLLTTFLRAEAPGFKPDSPKVAAMSKAALTRADHMGWCARPFWGWTTSSAQRAADRFASSNHRFATEIWGTDWPLPVEVDRPCTQIDFLDLDFEVVDQIQNYVLNTANRVAVRLGRSA